MIFLWGEWRWLAPSTTLALWAGLTEQPAIATGALVITLLLAALFIQKAPTVPALPLGILAPASGTIVGLESVQDNRLSRSTVRITIKVGLWDGYHCFSPTEGLIKECWHRPAETDPPAPSSTNSYSSYWVQTDEGDDLLVEQFRANRVSRAMLKLQPGERIGQGHLFGYLRFGGTVTCALPSNARLIAEIGQSVRAGEDLLANFVHPEGPHPTTGAVS